MASLPVDQFSHGSSLRRGVDLQRRDLCGVGRGPENLSWDEVFAGGVYGGGRGGVEEGEGGSDRGG